MHGAGSIQTPEWGSFLGFARKSVCEYVQVKTRRQVITLDTTKTHAFYRHPGFSELECFPPLRDERNPCRVCAKIIGSADA